MSTFLEYAQHAHEADKKSIGLFLRYANTPGRKEQKAYNKYLQYFEYLHDAEPEQLILWFLLMAAIAGEI